MKSISTFKAIYCSGLVLPNQATMAALALLFDKVYLPNNIEFVIDFAKRFDLTLSTDDYKDLVVSGRSDNGQDPFEMLSSEERETAYKYIDVCNSCAIENQSLFGEVIESDIFEGGNPFTTKLIEEGAPGELNLYEVSLSEMNLVGNALDRISSRIDDGYVPVVGNLRGNRLLGELSGDTRTSKELAALLAVQSVAMFFPATRDIPAELILEARDRLKDHLPLFWSSMLKLSLELKSAIKDCKSTQEVFMIGTEMVDTTVRPAIIELNHKIEKERKQWFYKIFGGIYKALKVAAANPPLTQEQLIRTSLLIGADATMDFADHLHKVESMKNEAGLTYLLELGALVEKSPNRSITKQEEALREAHVVPPIPTQDNHDE